MKIAIITLIVTQLMNLAFVLPLQHAGLALATGLGACINATLLYRGLRGRGIYAPQPGWRVFLLKLAIAVYAMGLVLWLAAGPAELWLAADWHVRVLRLAWLVPLGAATYFVSLWLLGFRMRDFTRHESR